MPQALFVFLEGWPAYTTRRLRARLEAAFAAAGLDPARHLLFLPRVSAREYSALLRRMDVVLDSPCWNGGNSTLETIAAGQRNVGSS